MKVTAEDHLARSVELLDMALRVTRDQSLPIPERADELNRLLERISGHLAAAEFLAEVAEEVAA
jgi:hypothetical protein